jgi:hypothetical protein
MMPSPSAMPAVSAFSRIGECVTDCSQLASTMSAKKPITTDGMPASISIAGLRNSRTWGGANSELYTAASTDSGTANSMAITTTLTVPVSSGTSPYLGTSPTGCHNGVAKKPARLASFWISGLERIGHASLNTNTTMSTSPATAEKAHVRSAHSMNSSRTRWRVRIEVGLSGTATDRLIVGSRGWVGVG